MLIKQKRPLLPRNLTLATFWELLIVFSTKVDLPYLVYSTTRRCFLLHLIKQNCLLKTFLRTQISLYLFSPLEIIWNYVIYLYLSDCIPVVVLKNYELELSYILAELFNKCLKESCFPDCRKVSSVVPVFKNVGERSTVKNFFLWLVKSLKNL